MWHRKASARDSAHATLTLTLESLSLPWKESNCVALRAEGLRARTLPSAHTAEARTLSLGSITLSFSDRKHDAARS